MSAAAMPAAGASLWAGAAGKETGAAFPLHSVAHASTRRQLKTAQMNSVYVGAAGMGSGLSYEVVGKGDSSSYIRTAPYANESAEWQHSTANFAGGTKQRVPADRATRSGFQGTLHSAGATMAYGYSKNMPFAAYGDATFVYAQTAIILLLIPFFRGNYALTLVYTALAMGAAFAVFNNLIGLEFITIAQQANIPLTVISRGIQIITNFSNKSAGQLSGITFFLSFAGCASRIFTSLVDAKDNLMALSFAVSTVLNGLVWGQILYYSGAKKDKKE